MHVDNPTSAPQGSDEPHKIPQARVSLSCLQIFMQQGVMQLLAVTLNSLFLERVDAISSITALEAHFCHLPELRSTWLGQVIAASRTADNGAGACLAEQEPPVLRPGPQLNDSPDLHSLLDNHQQLHSPLLSLEHAAP